MKAISMLSDLRLALERRRWSILKAADETRDLRVSPDAESASRSTKAAAVATGYRAVEAFERDYPAFLIALAASIRTGLDPFSALQHLEELFSERSALGRELRAVNEVINRGGREDEAIAAFGASVGHPDVPLFRSAFLLARREGSSLGQCLERLAAVTRARQSFRRKSKAAVAMQRLSAFGIAGCAVLIGLMQVVANLEAVRIALNHPVGARLLAIGAVLIIGGLVWMIRLTRVRV